MNLKELGIHFSETRSQRTFQKLYFRLEPGLKKYINDIVKDYEQTNDIFSVVMSTAYNKINQYNPKYHISTWIYRIAYTTSLMHLRTKKKRSTTPFSVYDSMYDNNTSIDILSYKNEIYEEDFQTIEEKEIERNQKILDIHEAINTLDPLYKDIIFDRYIKEMKYKEIAQKHDLPIQTIKNRILRGKKKLKQKFEIDANRNY